MPPDLDTTKYEKKIERNKKKVGGKVIVEDEFIEPTDFRDPGGRKKSPPAGKNKKSVESLEMAPPGTGSKDSKSNKAGSNLHRISSKEPSNSPPRSNNNGPPRSQSLSGPDLKQPSEPSGIGRKSREEPSVKSKNQVGRDRSPSEMRPPRSPISPNYPRDGSRDPRNSSPTSKGILKAGSQENTKYPRSPKGTSYDGNNKSLPDDPYGNGPQQQLRPEIDDNLSGQVRSENRGPADHYADGRLYIQSRENKPKTELGARDNQSIERTSLPPGYQDYG